MTAPDPRPAAPVAQWPTGHPDEEAHAALLQALTDSLEAGLVVPCTRHQGKGNPWITDAAGATGQRMAREAAAACADCPALTRCRSYALEAGEPGGVWGGMTPADRATELKTRRNRRAAA